MRRMWLASAILTLSVVTAVEQADAPKQGTGRGAVRGQLLGALIGGVAGGRRGAGTGALIGAATGALIAGNGQRRHGRYCWYRGNCCIIMAAAATGIAPPGIAADELQGPTFRRRDRHSFRAGVF